MKIKKLHIKNFKSIADLEIIEPNPFTVFIGPNGSGKSNIFEALEFWALLNRVEWGTLLGIFGGSQTIQPKQNKDSLMSVKLDIDSYGQYGFETINNFEQRTISQSGNDVPLQFVSSFSRIFPRLGEKRFYFLADKFLNPDADNLVKVLKRVLVSEEHKEEILDYLELLIPEFSNISIHNDSVSGKDTLLVKEKYSDEPFSERLISDGTYNILAILTAIFQSDEPQFLCIEEPENGLNPKVVKELVNLFRFACEEKRHYIWLNTHSQTLVSQLKPEEVITVNKIKGETKIKQFKGKDFHGLRMDEAWLSNALGGGLPW